MFTEFLLSRRSWKIYSVSKCIYKQRKYLKCSTCVLIQTTSGLSLSIHSSDERELCLCHSKLYQGKNVRWFMTSWSWMALLKCRIQSRNMTFSVMAGTAFRNVKTRGKKEKKKDIFIYDKKNDLWQRECSLKIMADAESWCQICKEIYLHL